MKRKVIQIANSTQLVSLPRKWSQKYGIKKGEELEVEEQGSKIVLSADKGVELKNIEIDVTGLDRTTILYYIQNLYRTGYDEIKVFFNTPVTEHFRLDRNVNVITVVHNEVNRLIGYEIIQQKENFCIIKDISSSSIQEFDTILRRVFLLLRDMSSELLKGALEIDTKLLETIEEKHDSITKFVSYCLRLLNKYGYKDGKHTIILYHILATLDKVVDVFKYASRDLLRFKHKLNNYIIQMFRLIDESINLYSDIFFKLDLTKATKIYKNRNEVLTMLYQFRNKIPTDELVLMSKMEHIFELLVEVRVARMGIQY